MENGDLVNIIGKRAACYENPLFEEDGAVINDTHTKIHHGQTDGIHTKPYELQAAQTSVHFKQRTPSKKKGLYICGAIIGIIAVIAISTAVIIGQRDGQSSASPSKSDTVLFYTRRVDGQLRISKGPFSTYKPEYSDSSSVSFTLFVSSFTYQMKSIFDHSDSSYIYSHTDVVNISSGSVIVNFILNFNQDLKITLGSIKDLGDTIVEGMSHSLFIIDAPSVSIQPIDQAQSVITTSKPGVCLPLSLPYCGNFTTWSTTTFPNLLGHRNPYEVMEAQDQYEELLYYSCGRDFWCAVFNPRCHQERALPPCRSYCRSIFKSCGHMYETNISQLINCDTLPESSNPNVCSQDPYKRGSCLENSDEMCHSFGYDHVSFPNFAGHRSPYQATEIIQLLAGINHAVHCYKHSILFACATMMPKCTDSGPRHVIPPCKSLCNSFKSRCEIFMDIFFMPWPASLYCDSFPDVNDTNVCLGFIEAHEPPTIDACQADEDRCDNTTCIPLIWKCDGFQDCKDGTDETAIQTTLPIRQCAVCPANMFRCSPKSTICVEIGRRCDGIEDCPTGSDERECVQLDDGLRQGILNVYNPNTKQWGHVCSDGWTDKDTNIVCFQLGYESPVGSSTRQSITSFALLDKMRNNSNSEYIQSKLNKVNHCNSGKAVTIQCGIPVCGIRPAYIPPLLRIVGGDLADPVAWPWQAGVYGGSDYKYFCGGTIIAERWILTAGHCIGGRVDPKHIVFKLGQPRRNTFSSYIQEVHPQVIYRHALYNQNTVDNDIALVYLNESIRFNDHVRPICLPPNSKRLSIGTRCVAVGWGKRNETAFQYERQLKQVYLEVVDQEDCKASIIGAERKVPYQLNEHMFCAGGGLENDACAGDSGGPLLCLLDPKSDRWYQGGIVSWGVGCAIPNVPGVYTNLPGYLDWIHNITKLDYL